MDASIVRDIERLSKAARDVFGKTHQLRVVVEECCELASALLRFERVDREDLFGSIEEAAVEENADVIIASLAARLILGPDRVDKVIQRKLLRLTDRIAEAKKGAK